MIDLMYFGNSFDNYEGPKIEKEFIELVTLAFPNVKLDNAYDEIKGYRQQVEIPDEQQDEYLAWIIGEGWGHMSLVIKVLKLEKDENGEFYRIYKIAKEKYSESFKKK
jgi:hypothetical protein